METSITGSALPEHGGRQRSAEGLRRLMVVIGPGATLFGALRRTALRLFDRVGLGLQRFDDNLWDGGDEA